jgi:hypothetical protein
MLCPNCQTENPPQAQFCTSCGSKLADAPAPPQSSGDETIAKVIPYKNAAALTAYYLGVFSLIPCVGLILGIAALVLGIIGLKFAKRNPQAHGTVHAWVGVVLGTITFIGNVVGIVLMVIASRGR